MIKSLPSQAQEIGAEKCRCRTRWDGTDIKISPFSCCVGSRGGVRGRAEVGGVADACIAPELAAIAVQAYS